MRLLNRPITLYWVGTQRYAVILLKQLQSTRKLFTFIYKLQSNYKFFTL